MAQGDLVARMIGAATLNIQTYEEVEADSTATGQAAAVVAMVAVASGIGAIGGGLSSAIFAPVGALLGWLVWAGVTYLIGDKILGGTATWGELLRTLGFAQSPGVLYLLAVLPLVGWVIRLVLPFWMLVAGVIGFGSIASSSGTPIRPSAPSSASPARSTKALNVNFLPLPFFWQLCLSANRRIRE